MKSYKIIPLLFLINSILVSIITKNYIYLLWGISISILIYIIIKFILKKTIETE
ncbi:MAG: hypothetical protein QXV69_01280 [Sulfolobaceae archaeon]